MSSSSRNTDVVPLGEATRAWWKVSLQTFGGPAGQIAVMHRELVDDRRWIGERRFLHALSYCTLLPGPEAQQLAIYLGWLLNGTPGGLIAGSLFVLPGFLAILALSALYARFGETLAITAIFAGVSPAVLAIVTQAVVRVGKRALVNRFLQVLAVTSFVALVVFDVPFPVVVVVAAVAGWLGSHLRPGWFAGGAGHGSAPDGPPPLIADDALHGEPPTWSRAAEILVIGLILWVTPVIVAALTAGGDSVFVTQGKFFGLTTLVTFGGAYAVLAFVAQRAVEVYGWLTATEMVKGLALAETTPGPLIMVVEFVAFLGAYRDPGGLNPWVAGVLAATLVTWVTFVPCFVFIFLGAPHIEQLRGNERLTGALSAITAAVVGVIANLAVFFAAHTLFGQVSRRHIGWARIDIPAWSTFSPRAAAVAALGFVLIFKLRWSTLRVLGTCAAIGGVWYAILNL